MNKKTLSLLVVLVTLACKAFTPVGPKISTEGITPIQPTVASVLTEAPPEKSSSASAMGFTIVRLKPEDGDLGTMLKEEAKKAANLGQIPVVEFDATWCPPCQAIDAAIKAKDSLMMDAYAGTYIIKLDVDEWGWNDDKVDFFQFEFIPVYFKLDTSGNPTGEMIDGGAWNEDIPENIAPVMDKFFHGES